MTAIDNFRATAQEVVSFARPRGVDLEPLRKDFTFMKERRWIDVWRKDEMPYSGPAGEEVGTLHYNMQGAISILPSQLKGSEGAFHGQWSEAGTFESIEQAFELVKAWLVDWSEVDDLPRRVVRRYGI